VLTFVADKDCCEVHCTHDLLCRRLLACGPVLVQMVSGPGVVVRAGPGADVGRYLVQMWAGPWCRWCPVLVQMCAGPGADVRRSLVQMWAGTWCRCGPVPGVDARCGCIWKRTRRVCGTAVPRVKAAALAPTRACVLACWRARM
jgi:hypothetical protein